MTLSDDDEAPLGRRDLQDRAIRGASWTIVHTLVAIPVAFVVNLVLARTLGASEYGRLAVLTTLMTIATGIATAGSSGAVLQFGAKSHAAGRGSEVAHLLSIAQGFELLVVAPVLTVVVVALADVSPAFLVAGIVFGIWVPAYLNQALLGLAIENKTSAVAKITMVSSLVSQVGVVVVAVLLHSADAVWLARLVVSALLVTLALVPLSPRYRRAVLRPSLPRRYPPGFWRFAIPTGAAALLATLVTSRTEVFVLGWASTTVEVGVFALAFGLAAHLFAPAQALVGPLLPAISGLREVDEPAVLGAFHRTLRASSTVVGLITATVLPALTLLIPTLYGEEFASASPLFLALGLAGALLVVATPVSVFVHARLQGRALLTASAVALVVDVGLAFALIPTLGAWGAVIANIGGSMTQIYILLQSELRAARTSWTETLRHSRALIYGGGVAVAAWAVGRPIPGPWLSAAVAAVVGLLLLMALFRLFGEE